MGPTDLDLLAAQAEATIDAAKLGGTNKWDIPAFARLYAERTNPLATLRGLPNLAAAHVAIQNDAQGPNATITTACSAGTQAIGEGMRLIQRGDADVVLAGGTDAGSQSGRRAGLQPSGDALPPQRRARPGQPAVRPRPCCAWRRLTRPLASRSPSPPSAPIPTGARARTRGGRASRRRRGPASPCTARDRSPAARPLLDAKREHRQPLRHERRRVVAHPHDASAGRWSPIAGPRAVVAGQRRAVNRRVLSVPVTVSDRPVSCTRSANSS